MSKMSNGQLVRSAIAIFAMVLISGVIGCKGEEPAPPAANAPAQAAAKPGSMKTGPATATLDPSATIAQPGAKAGDAK